MIRTAEAVAAMIAEADDLQALSLIEYQRGNKAMADSLIEKAIDLVIEARFPNPFIPELSQAS